METKIFKINLNSKEQFIDQLIDQIDDIRFCNSIKNPCVEIVVSTDVMLSNIDYELLFNELVIRQGVVISKITTQNHSIMQYAANEMVLIGNVSKDMTLICNQNLRVIGKIEGTIILLNEQLNVYGKEFNGASIIVNNQLHTIEHQQNYVYCMTK